MLDSASPYDVLGVDTAASLREIKVAYRRRAAVCHPDSGGTHSEFVALQQAYALLTDPDRRHEFDQATAEPTADDTAQPDHPEAPSSTRSSAAPPMPWQHQFADVTEHDVLHGVKVTPGAWVDVLRYSRWVLAALLAIAALMVVDAAMSASAESWWWFLWVAGWVLVATACIISAARGSFGVLQLLLAAVLTKIAWGGGWGGAALGWCAGAAAVWLISWTTAGVWSFKRVSQGNRWGSEGDPATTPLIVELSCIPAVRIFNDLAGGLVEHVVVCGRRAAVISTDPRARIKRTWRLGANPEQRLWRTGELDEAAINAIAAWFLEDQDGTTVDRRVLHTIGRDKITATPPGRRAA